MRFTLGEPAPTGGSRGGAPASPTLYLTRGEPVSITVVNRLREPTTVHWHGIELESYHDGVAGFGGYGRRLAPIIAPGDSFEARFTPPRAGTFMYHSHVNEPRQHRAGLAGALIVRDAARPDSAEDVVLLLKSARAGPRAPVVLEVNGRSDPDTTVLRAGRRYRLRLISIAVGNPAATVWITARRDSAFQRPRDDTLLVRWRPLAKDGADLPERERTPRLARQVIGMGETYDFELVPERRGDLRVEVRAAILRERLFVRVPIRVE
jgi:FtsP/CotA-like multicopper oxidase with cupredoxin domain